jgi:hypothetical protein
MRHRDRARGVARLDAPDVDQGAQQLRRLARIAHWHVAPRHTADEIRRGR